MRHTLVFPLYFALLGLVIISCGAFGGSSSKPTVIIASPPSGSLYTVGENVIVQSTSTDPLGVTRVTLLVDGNIVRDDPSPVAQGQAQYSVIQAWVADGVGQHTLTVRATNAQGGTADSGVNISVQLQQGDTQPTPLVSIATAVPVATSNSQPSETNSAGPTADSGSACTSNSKFVADLTIPDGTVFVPGAVFTKSWRVANSGTCPWENVSLVFVNGTQMAGGNEFPVPATAPGATADLTVPMTAPSKYGPYEGTWMLRDAAGHLFGTNMTVVISVPSPATSIPVTPTSPPTNTPAACTGKPNDFIFTASAANVTAGQSVTLTWSAVTNASAVFIDGGEFSDEGVETPATRVVTPTATTTYTLTAQCGSSGQSRSRAVTVALGAASGNFNGGWVLNFGSMNLTQNGDTVIGTFEDDLAGQSGIIQQATVSGNTLTGSWQVGSQNGSVELTLSNDGKRVTGTRDSTNAWCGARAGQKFPDACSYDGNWTTDQGSGPTCNMMLTRHDDIVNGSYCEGTLTGTLTYTGGAAVLSGNWINNGTTGTLVFYLNGYAAQQFNGNWNTANPWCGYRSGSSAPTPCKYP